MASSANGTLCSSCSRTCEDLCRLSCGDAICRQCVNGQLERQSSSTQFSCPTCETVVNVPDVEQQREPRQTDTLDEGTNNVITDTTIATHHASAASRLVPVAATVVSGRDGPVQRTTYHAARAPALVMENAIARDRNKFCCPYCEKGPYGREALVQHCLELHTTDSNQEQVCPLCAAEPWGNAEQKSRNFIEHLTYRHQFDYDAFVRRDMDEDEALNIAINRSMNK